MSRKLMNAFGALLAGTTFGAVVVYAATVLPPLATAALAGVAVLAVLTFGRPLFGGRAGARELAEIVEASLGKDLTIPESRYANSPLLPLVHAINRYGENLGQLVGQASNRSNQVVQVSRAMTDSAGQVTRHAEQQAARTTELAAAMEQMNATIHEIAQNASRTFDSATRITKANADGVQNMDSVAASVSDISQLFERVVGVMSDLRQASDEIGKVLGVINGIAEQTNLLALNAAIEAARAGEQGRGFAVVADEVRKLAEITKKSTQEISQTITRNQELTVEVSGAMDQGQDIVRRSVEQTETTKTALNLVAAGIDDVNGMIHQIASATEEQSAAVGEITRNIEHIAALSAETQRKAEVSQRSSQGLTTVAKELEQRVNSFNLSFFGLVPLEDALHMNSQFGPLAEFIGKILNRQLVVRLGDDYNQAIEDLGSGRALISYQTPSTYIDAHDRYGIEPLAVPLAKGEPFYRSAIVARADSGISTLAELRGKRFAFGDPKSTGSKAMPESMLKEGGIRLSDLAEHAYLGSHDNVAKAVLQKDYAAGGLMLSAAEKYTGKGLRILATSAPIPQFPLCAAPGLSAEDRQRVVDALVELRDPQILAAMGAHVTGFAPIKDSDYDGVRTMLKRLKS